MERLKESGLSASLTPHILNIVNRLVGGRH